MENNMESDNYLFFSSLELIDYFKNNLAEKDIKIQVKRILEMARVFMEKKEFSLDDLYSVLVMVRDISKRDIINEVFQLYFQEGRYPVGIFVQISELESSSDIEIEFSAFRGEKLFINPEKKQNGPYSEGAVIENYVHCSGVAPVSKPTTEGIKKEVEQCLDKLQDILAKGNTSLDKAYSFIVYLKDINLLPQVEEVFTGYGLDREEILLEAVKVDQLYQGHDLEISCSANIQQKQ